MYPLYQSVFANVLRTGQYAFLYPMQASRLGLREYPSNGLTFRHSFDHTPSGHTSAHKACP